MQFNFNFEAFEKSGKDKNEAIKYLKGLNSSLDFDKLESDLKGDTEAIYNTLKGGNFSFSKPSIEDTREKLLKNKENEALKAEFNAGLSWLSEGEKQDYNFYDFKKAKERANSKEGLIKADLEAKEKELKRKEALFEKRLENENIFTKSLRDTADNLGLNAAADVLELGLNKLGFKDENYIFESEKEDIKKRALKSVREKLERGDLELNEREKYALRAKYDELDYKKALGKEKEKLRLIQKNSGYDKSEVEFMEEELGFFHTLFNDTKDTIREFKDTYKSEGIVSADVQKAINVLKQFEKSELLRHAFSDKKQELQQEYLKNALVIAELNGFDDVGLSHENELYFIKKDKDKEQKYLVNTGFLDNFWDLIENSKFEIAGGIAGGIKGFNSGKSAKGKVVKSILGAAAGSFSGGLMDAKIADMYLNRESDYSRNLEYALQAGLLSLAGDGVIIAAKPMVKGVAKGAKGLYTYAKEHTPLGLFSIIPSQNINAANKIIDEVFSPEMKEELKQAQKDFGGGVRAQDLANPVFEKLKENFAKRYGKEDKKTKSIEKLAEIFNQNSLKTKQQEMLDLIRSDKDGSTLAYLLEVAKDDVKIQNNLKNMLNLASANVEKNLKNLNINPREIKSILDEFEAGNKAAFKEVETQIAKLYNEDIKVVLDRNTYENIKKDFLQNGVNLDEMTPFLRDLENNVFSKEGVSFAKLNNFRKNLNYYIFNKDKTPNFINTLKKIAETSLKAEIDKGIDNIFKELPKAYESIKELYSTSLKDYAAMKELNESIKNLRLQDSAKSADEVVDSLIKYAKGQGEGGVNNLQKIKAYLGEENNAFLEMQILNRLFKESMVENDRAKVRVFDSESFLNRVKELVGGNELYERKLGKEFLQQLSPSPVPKQLSIDEFLNTLENFKNKENFLKHIEKDPKRKDYLNLIEPTLKEPDIAFKKLENGVEKEKFIKKFSDGKDFFYLLATKDNKETILTAFKTDKINTILKEFNADIIPTFIRQGSKGKAAGTTAESITQPLFKSKEAREFLELVEGFDKLYKNDAIIAKNLTQGTASKLSTSIATSAEGAIKQKVVKGGFDPIFRLLPDGVLFGLFSKQIQGGALRYHLKKALSRSLNYDDFKLKLERELKRTNFNSNTSRLIEKLMQNLEDFNAEKEAKLAQIKAEQEQIYQAQEANNLKDILETQLKEDFGENFEGFKGKEAVLKLLEEKRGQVKGAFYKEGLGEIDLVWGDENFGLRHILNKHGGEFENLARELSEAVENGKIVKDDKGRLRLEYENKIVGIKDNWKGEKTNHWVVTAYVKKEKEASLYASTSFTKGEALPLNSKQSIAQKALMQRKSPVLNDEPLEVEIIEEVGLNEPMKFLEFQQKKLLTYIKQNTPLRLLEHKSELKTRDILNFLEQSALNGKEKAFLMRNFERDLGKIEVKIKEKESVKESETIDNVKYTRQSLFNEEANFKANFEYETQKAKQKTINKVDAYAKSEAFKALSKDKQEAILSLKSIKPSIMPDELSKDNLENIFKHFNSKQDKAQREFYAKLFNDTKENPHIVLEVKRENELRQEYIKAYQHKDTHDLYYIAITKDKDTINVTGYPITKIKDVINQIKNAEKVVWRQQGDQAHTALVSKETQNLESADESIAQKTKSENTQDFKPFNDAMKELYGKYESLNTYNKIEGQVKMKLLQDEIKPQIARHFKGIITKLKQGENKDKMLRVIKENREELSDYLAFNIAVRKDINIDGYGEGGFDFYDKFIQAFAKLRDNKRVNEINEDSNYRALAALVNLRDKNTALHFSFSDLNGKSEGFKSYPRKQDLLFDDLTLGDHFKSAMLLSTKDKQLKEKLIKKLKTYIDKRLYRDFLEYKIKDLESKNPKNSFFENYENKKWDEEAFEAYKKELEDLRANERAEKLEGKIKEKETRGSEDIIFTDTKGKEHTLSKEAREQWLETFNLKSLDEEAIVEIPVDLKERLGKEIKLNKKDFEKLVKNKREKYIPQIKETFKEPEAVFIDENKDLIFAKSFNDKLFFVNVNRDYGEAFKALSLAPKKNNNLLNKLDKAKEILKLDSKLRDYTAQQAFTGVLSASNKPSSESIAQKPQQKALNLQEIEQALKARISQINDEIFAIERVLEDKAFRKKLKEASKVKPVLEALKEEWKALEPFIITWTHTDYSKFKPKKYYNRRPNLSNLWHIEETLDVYKGYARENERQAKQVEREIALLEKYVKLLKDKEAEVKKLETDKKALLSESYIIPVYNKLREAFKNGQHTTEQILEAKNIDIKRDNFIAEGIINGIAQLRQYLEQFFNITPLKEFGTNYAEFYKDGKGAVEKLLAEKGGQVSGAFYKEGLGEIDLVWGDENFGLKHILNKHGGEFEDIAEELDKIIQNGEVVKRKGRDEAYNIEYKGFKVGINKGFNKQGENKWVVTAFDDNIEKTAKTAPANDSTKGASLPLNSKESIPQNSEKLPFEMQVLAEDKLSGDEVRHLANKIGEKSTMGYFKKYLLKMDRDFHARAKDIIREYYKIEPFRKELENQWANVKEAYKNGEMSLKEFKFLSKYKDEKSFLNQVAEVLWYHSDELVKRRGHTINKYGQIEEGKANYYQNLALEYDGALKTLKKWFYYIQKANKQAQKFFNKKELEEFGANFEGFKGKEAVLKLLEEKRGQVKGAFYKEGLGEIDLVWGDENFGLRHIIEQRAKQWGEEKALKFISHLSENIEKGQIVELEKGRVGIKTDLTTIILDKKENNNFVLTAFRDRNNKKELESLNLSQSKTFTSENAETNAKESPVTPLNQESIIPQRSINLAMEKFHYDEKKAVDENKLYKSLNESLKAGWDFFKANNKDDYNDKLFNNVIRVANDLDVRFWYQPNAKWMNGSYTYALNRIMLRSDFQTSSNAKTMLHELIHGVTSRAIYAYEDKIFRQKLSKEQIEGIEELKKLFKEVLDKNEAKAWKKAGNFKAEVELNEGANTLYGLRDEHEFLAELANPQFRSFLKEQNLFAQIIEAMAKIFSYVKEKLSGKVKSVSAKEELEGILYKIMDNYNNPHEFSTQMSEYFGSRNFVDIKRFKDYIKNNKEQFDKDNGKYPFKFFDNSKLSNAEKDAFKGKAEYEEVTDRSDRLWREDDGLYDLWVRSRYETVELSDPLNEDERQILKNHKEQSYLKDLKNAVENYYKVNYDEFNNAFNGAFKDKHFFKAKKGDEKRDKRGGFIYNASDDVKFLLALKPYFESGLYKILDENDFKRIEENIIRILKEEHLKYRNKPLNEWLAKEWVEKDVANLLEAKASPFTQKQELENKEANVHTLREQTKELLSALVGKNITNQNDGRIASISRKNIMKMTSDKAIQKSVNNGFTPQEHFKAVQNIESLYQAAVLKETHADRKSNNPNVFIHRYTADFNGNNALITIKESLDNNSKGNKIYTLELEALELKPSAPEPQGSVTMSKNTGYAEPVTPNETHKSIIAQKNENIPHSNPHLGAGLVGGSLNGVEQDEEGNLSFDPAKFAMGFLGGSLGSKAVSKGIKWRANKVKKAYPNIAKDNPVLMEQIAKRDLLTYAKNESANALTRFLNKNKLFDSTRGLFAGEKALLNEAYAPQKARLKKAKELENKGADEIEIWEKTGWYKDKDKKWKFEISQRGGEFKWDLLKKVGEDILSEDRSMRLEEVLQDDALFRAYPQLKELKIRAVEINDSVLGQYSEVKKNIMLSPNLNSMRAKRTLYHELQHAVQDIEGFAYGDKWELRKNYKLRHGEVEARNVENRLLTRKNDLKKLDKEIQKLTKEIQNEESAELGDYEKFSLALKKKDLVDMLEFKDKILSLDDEIIKKHPHKTMDTPLSETIAESTIQGEALSKELENYNPLAQVKEKVVRKISNYTKLRIFKSLSKDKQDAILSLKDIKPQPMPDTIAKENLENLFKHFENKQDKNARVYYSKLFSDTKKKPHLILETKGKQGQNRKEYVKVYQHKATHDLYYIVVTENNDKINITAHPITEIKELIRHIRNSERASVIKDSNQAPT